MQHCGHKATLFHFTTQSPAQGLNYLLKPEKIKPGGEDLLQTACTGLSKSSKNIKIIDIFDQTTL